ncbi:hypothetical protein OROMI_030810 [Orobanche minor]
MATLEEDFSFPATATTDSPPHFVESPPLWRRPNKSRIFKCKEVEDEEMTTLRSFQEFKKSMDLEEGGDEAERMDILWENLNDECSINRAVPEENTDPSSSPGMGVRISCTAKSMKLSGANGHMFSCKKKPIILVFIKVVKKVFTHMEHSHRIKKVVAY